MSHIPVLLKESVGYLITDNNGIYIDATLGGGGTTEKILDTISRNGRVIGIDRDPHSIETASQRLLPYTNFTAVRKNFRALGKILQSLGIEAIDGLIADLGISSMQIDDPRRGFSFKSHDVLDMRMDPEEELSAQELVNRLDEETLCRIFREYGQERWAGRIASNIVKYREQEVIETPAQLAKLVEDSIPKRFHSRRIHPATRIFLALRIEVNQELQALKELLNTGIDLLKPGGRIVIISYHSLEDRIVKWNFRQQSQGPEKKLLILTKKPIIPNDEEIEQNRRSRSAKLRAAQKI